MSGSASVVLFDVMGTLVHDPFFREMPAFFGMSLKELIAVKHPTAWVEFEHGAIDEAACLAKFFLDARPVDGERLKQVLAASYAWLPGVEPLLAELRDRGVEMHALSNYSSWYRLIEERLQLSRYVQWTFVSCDTGVRKPDPEAYLGAARALKRPPAECLFVDDRKENVKAALEVGMRAVRFVDAEGLRADLRAMHLLP